MGSDCHKVGNSSLVFSFLNIESTVVTGHINASISKVLSFECMVIKLWIIGILSKDGNLLFKALANSDI